VDISLSIELPGSGKQLKQRDENSFLIQTEQYAIPQVTASGTLWETTPKFQILCFFHVLVFGCSFFFTQYISHHTLSCKDNPTSLSVVYDPLNFQQCETLSEHFSAGLSLSPECLYSTYIPHHSSDPPVLHSIICPHTSCCLIFLTRLRTPWRQTWWLVMSSLINFHETLESISF
jgi:hypothetical protein